MAGPRRAERRATVCGVARLSLRAGKAADASAANVRRLCPWRAMTAGDGRVYVVGKVLIPSGV